MMGNEKLTQASFLLICVGDSTGTGYGLWFMPRHAVCAFVKKRFKLFRSQSQTGTYVIHVNYQIL